MPTMPERSTGNTCDVNKSVLQVLGGEIHRPVLFSRIAGERIAKVMLDR